MIGSVIELTAEQKLELTSRSRSRSLRSEDSRKARLILMLAEGCSYAEIRDAMGCDPGFISRWKKRFEAEGLVGLATRHQGSCRRVLTPKLEARILEWTRRKPSDGSTHWTTRKLTRAMSLKHHMLVAEVWKRANLKPQRIKRYMVSYDPDFEKKAADVIGLYVNPPQHAAVFCLDEKTAIQALDRLDPVLPLSPGRLERHGFEYYRHGTLSLYAALNTQTGEVLGKTAGKHTSAEFVAFLGELVSGQPKSREIHVIVDNLSTHKTERVQLFLQEHAQ